MSPRFQPSRRTLLKQSACGFGSLALSGMAGSANATVLSNPLAAKDPPMIPRAKRVIFLFMQGGPSQVDTFDLKPELQKRSGEKMKFFYPRTGLHEEMTLYGSPWEHKRYGETGHAISDLFPHIGKHVDDLCFLHGMQTEGVAHGPSTLFMHTGATNLIRPSMGSWVMYGLGTENANLPGFISIGPSSANGGPRNFGNAFLPADFQGTAIGRAGLPAKKATIEHLTNSNLSYAEQRKQLEFLQKLNRTQITQNQAEADTNLEAVINSFELAYRMQSAAPDVMDLESESKATQELYGIDEKHTEDFGRQCLTARRLAESGVRYIQVNYSDNGSNPRWDQHSNLPKHAHHAAATDKPVAGLLADLKARGLLEDTIVWWGGEFGRTPFSQGKDGRDHNPRGFTVWLAGGGFKPGMRHGATDEFGNEAISGKVHMHDLHATILHQLGLNHKKLTYQYAGRDFRLTDVHGNVVHEVIS